MTNTATGNITPSKILVALGAALALAAAFTYLTLEPPDDDEVNVDLSVVWTPQRELTVHWQIGALIAGERFTAEDAGSWNINLNLPRGTELVILVEQDPPGGYLACRIQAEGRTELTELDGPGDCRVEMVA